MSSSIAYFNTLFKFKCVSWEIVILVIHVHSISMYFTFVELRNEPIEITFCVPQIDFFLGGMRVLCTQRGKDLQPLIKQPIFSLKGGLEIAVLFLSKYPEFASSSMDSFRATK